MNESSLPALPGPLSPAPAPPREAETEQNPLAMVHRLLRGRYLYAIALAAVLGGGAGAVGYLSIRPVYQSDAIIRVAPVLPKVLYESEQSASIPMFDAYVGTQVSLIRSRRVVEMALQSATWADAKGTYSIEDIETFSENLAAVQPAKSQLIRVSYSDSEPQRARAGVKAVVDAYQSIYVEGDRFADAARLKLLEDRERALTAELDRLSARILEIANEFGSSALSGMHAYELEQLQTVKTQLETAKLELVAAEARASDDGAASGIISELTVEQIAAMDVRMQSLTDGLRNMEFKASEWEATYRNPERQPEYKSVQRELEAQRKAIEDYAEQFRRSYSPDAGGVRIGAGATGDANADLERARSRVERLQALYDESKAGTVDLGRKNLQIENLRSEMARVQERLDTTRFRIEQLNVESAVPGRITLLSEAETPHHPANARRRVQLGILGGLAGGGAGIGAFLLVGLVNPRVRDMADAERVRPRLLGALPALPEKVTDPAEAVIASQCVHHIRTMLPGRKDKKHGLALAVTSAASGTGKTSLTLSLGISYAMTGARTLLIDGDLLGMGLTRRTGAVGRRKLGRVFRDYEIVSDDEAKQALELSGRTGLRIGEALRELGYISDTDLHEGLCIQQDMALGLADALNGEPPETCIAAFGMSNLSILPSTDPGRAVVKAMSPSAVRALLDRLRDLYDVILIDTGPVPGTTDATVMTSSADGVIMVVSRGDLHTNVQRSIAYVQRIGAPLAGVVMNRATTRDLQRSGHSSSGGSEPAPYAEAMRKREGNALTARLNENANYGPLAQSVLSVSAG